MDESADRDVALAALLELHAEVDREAREIAGRHAGRLHCARGCADCCLDELAVHEVEAERIRRRHPELLREGTPHPAGRCAFLDDALACRIYPDRPYVCRTQGLPLRWFAAPDSESPEDAGKDVVELRDICPLNLDGPELAELPDADCWLLGPYEERLEVIATHFDCESPARVSLRSLFRRGGR